MIKKNTLLILGAGASVNFGFPLGLALLWKIIDFLNENTKEFYALCHKGFDETYIKKFRKALSCEDTSIDSFLEYNKEFLVIGKVSIALALLPCEITENLFVNAKDRERNWYQLLFGRLSRDCPFDKFQDNKLRIITFNYDRSLEQFLYERIQSKYNSESEADCIAKVKSIPIIHVHGRLGCLPWQEPENENEQIIEYDSYKTYKSVVAYPATPEQLSASILKPEYPIIDTYAHKAAESSKSIKIIHHEVQSYEEKVYDLIKENNAIHFLGFGYHPENMTRLKLKDYYQSPEAPICGTGMGLSLTRLTEIASLGFNRLQRRKYPPPQSIANTDIYTYLHDHVILA